MKSELILSVFKDELERTKRLISRYESEVETLPKGSIFKRKIGNNEYFYLNYREGKRVISKFLGKIDSYDEVELREKIEQRKKIEKLLKKLHSEQKQLEKELK
ncbi:MAG: hypothetical protein IJS09_10265 [Treponema sp.]|nr:hypothetical protein [Treponema sp.]